MRGQCITIYGRNQPTYDRTYIIKTIDAIEAIEIQRKSLNNQSINLSVGEIEREMRRIRHVLDRYNVIPNGKCQFLLSNEMEQFQTSKPIFVTMESVYGFRLEFLFFFYFYLISYID